MRELLKVGAQVEQADLGHLTPLSIASLRGQSEQVQVLLQAGAPVDARDYKQMTPFTQPSRAGPANPGRQGRSEGS